MSSTPLAIGSHRSVAAPQTMPVGAPAATARASQVDGPFFEVDLGEGARPPASSNWKDKVANALGHVALGGAVALGLMKEGLQRADRAILQPIEKGMASAWKAVASLPGRIADGFQAQGAERSATGSVAAAGAGATASVTATAPAPARSIGEMALAAHATVLKQEATFAPGNAGATLRGCELKESDKALRDMVEATFGAEIQSFQDSLSDTEVATFRGNPVDTSLARGALRTDREINESVDRFIDNMERFNQMVFGDGSDAAIRATVDRLPMDACTLVAGRHNGADQMDKPVAFKTALKDLLSGQEGSLRTFVPLLSRGVDRDSLHGKNTLNVAGFYQHCTKAEAAQGDLPKSNADGAIPESRRPQLEALAIRTHDNLVRLGAAMAERGAAAFQAISFENLLAIEEMSDFAR